MQFGTRAAAFPEAGGNSGDVFVRTFKDPSTTIRIAPETWFDEEKGKEVTGTEAWYKELEHFDRERRRSFPCPVPHGMKREDCPGCSSENEDVRKRSAKWYFNALDEKGYLRVYKIGIKLLKKFKFREQRLGNIYDRDYEVIKDGKEWNEIEYELEAGDKEPRPIPEKLHDIPKILSRQWQEALESYGAKPAVVETENDREEDAPLRMERFDKDLDVTPEVEVESNGNGQGAHADAEEVKRILAEWGVNPDPELVKRAATNVIKAFLDSEPAVEYPSRAPRSRLVTMAVEKAAAPPF